MTRKKANSTCVVCHSIIPRTEMRQVEITEKTGRSGRSTTIRKPAKGQLINLSVNSGRNYYRKKKVWVCKTCKAPRSLSAGAQETIGAFKSLLFWVVIIYLILVATAIKENYKKTNELIPGIESFTEILLPF